MTLAEFRTAFPAFADIVKYPDALISFWLGAAAQLVNPARWSTLTSLGIGLFTAHSIAVESQALASGASGQVPGGKVGLLSSKSAGGVSASYDISSVTEKDAGWWNLTTYGMRFYRFSRLMGAGPVQVGIPSAVDLSFTGGGAWPGVITPVP